MIGGGAARAGELLLEPARRIAAGYVAPGLGERTTIRLARHGVEAGVLGAALLAVHELGDRRSPSPTEVELMSVAVAVTTPVRCRAGGRRSADDRGVRL